MFAKLFVLSCLCAAAVAAPGILDGYGSVGYGAAYAAPAYGAAYAAPAYTSHAIAAPVAVHAAVRAEPVDPNPAYSFSYGVSDPHTGDQKDATESLQNGVVHGSYSLVEPDGHLRRVTYTADNVNGFNAVVERTGGGHAVAAAPIAKVFAAPAHVAVAAPVARYTLPALGHHVAHPWG